MTRRIARTDANHAGIRDGLRAAGFTVYDTSSMSEGFPDLVVIARSGRVLLLEVKAPDNGRMTPAEVKFCVSLANENYRVFTSAEAAIEAAQGL